MKTLLVLNGTPPEPEQFQRAIKNADFWVAVDGGVQSFLQQGIKPHVHIGDFDSSAQQEHTTVHIPSQDRTDFQKALQWVLEKGGTSHHILGGLGGRLDHTLTNLYTTLHVPDEHSVFFQHGKETLTRVTPSNPYDKKHQPGTVISLLPMMLCEGVVSNGLHWDLNNQCLSPTGLISQSNKALLSHVQVSLKKGGLYFYCLEDSK